MIEENEDTEYGCYDPHGKRTHNVFNKMRIGFFPNNKPPDKKCLKYLFVLGQLSYTIVPEHDVL